jgi:hypothetical protein
VPRHCSVGAIYTSHRSNNVGPSYHFANFLRHSFSPAVERIPWSEAVALVATAPRFALYEALELVAQLRHR